MHAPYNAGAYGDPVLELRDADSQVILERFPRSDHYGAQIDAFNASCWTARPTPARWSSRAATR